jgi:hypothetical protein
MRCGADELYVTTTDETDTYALDTIVRIDFIPNTTTVGVDENRRMILVK